jgi:hypothetical protein
MILTRHNYEEYFLLYVDNELKVEERAEVERFIREHPDLSGELANLQKAVLVADEADVQGFDTTFLYKIADPKYAPVVPLSPAAGKAPMPLWKRGLPVAAALLLLASGAAFWFTQHTHTEIPGKIQTTTASNLTATTSGGETGSAQATGGGATSGSAQATSGGATSGSAQAPNSASALTPNAGTAQTTGRAGGSAAQKGDAGNLAQTSGATHAGSTHVRLTRPDNTTTKQTGLASSGNPNTTQPGTDPDKASSLPSRQDASPALAQTQTGTTGSTAPTTLRGMAATASGTNGAQTGTSAPDQSPVSNPTQIASNNPTTSKPSVTNNTAVSYHTIEDQDDNNSGNKILFVRTDQVMNSGVKGLFRRAGRVIKHGTTLSTDNVHAETDTDKQN